MKKGEGKDSMSDFRAGAHLKKQIGDVRWRTLIDSANTGKVKVLLDTLGRTVFYTLLSDEEVVAWIIKYAKKSKAKARQFLLSMRQQARMRGVADTIRIFVEVQHGCLFKRDVPKMGPTWDDFKYLQNWKFSDPETEHALLTWIPVPIDNSFNKNVAEQMGVVQSFKSVAAIPEWCALSFGSINHVSGLALAHFNATGKDPFNGLFVRTDTGYSGSCRLELDWGGSRLDCGRWGWDAYRGSDVAVFVMGVVKALGSACR